jgi:hypothetical protein
MFPEDYEDAEVLKSVPKFVFPYESYHACQPVEHFSFVLTDINSKFKFGFCRLSAGTQPHSCLCIVSCLPWHEIFFQLLDSLSNCLNSSTNRPIVPLLTLLYAVNNFKPGEPISVADVKCNQKYSFTCPELNQLPSMPENRNLSEFVSSFDVHSMMVIFASLVNERRVLMVSETLSRLTACVHAAAALIYPMFWQHLFIPVLPPVLLDYCCAPMPFLIGLHNSVVRKMRKQDLGDVVTVDVDTGSITSEYDDISLLPEDVVSTLKRNLKSYVSDGKTSTRQVVGDGISRAFLKAMVVMIGGYRDALRFRPGEQITFDPNAFLLSRPAAMQPFLQRTLQLQTFQQFVSDRLDMLNSGAGFSDEFDTEVNMYGDQWGTQSRYKDWLSHMKKQGKKLKKEGRDRWMDFAGKVRTRSKQTFKELKAKIEDMKKDEAENVVQPSTRITVAYHVARKPPRPPPPATLKDAIGQLQPNRQSAITRHGSSCERTQRYRLVDVVDDFVIVNGTSLPRRSGLAAIDDSALFEPVTLPSVDMDLTNDPDILKVCRKSYSLEDLVVDVSADSTPADTESESSPRLAESTDVNPLPFHHQQPGVDGGLSVSSGLFPAAASAPNFETMKRETPSPVATNNRLPSPVPAPRHNATRRPILGSRDRSPVVTMATDESHGEPLILLDTSSSSSVDSRENILEFDPLISQTKLNETSSNDKKDSSSTCSSVFQSLTNFSDTNCSVKLASIESIDKLSVSNSSPVPRPRTSKQHPKTSTGNPNLTGPAGRINISRAGSTGSEISESGNTGVGRVGVQPVREARANFIQSTAPAVVTVCRPRQSSLDQFDPLATGQLAVDGLQVTDGMSSNKDSDNDLLKEWNLDFGSVSGGSVGGTTVRPADNVSPSPVGFVSMPNLSRPVVTPLRYPGNYGLTGLGAFGPQQQQRPQAAASQPWSVNNAMSQPNSVGVLAPAVPRANFQPPANVVGSVSNVTGKCATLPAATSAVPAFSVLRPAPVVLGRPSSTDLMDLFGNSKGGVQPAASGVRQTDAVQRPHSVDLEGLFDVVVVTSQQTASLTTTLMSRDQKATSQTWESFD